jgi:hypothetical protein
MTSVWDARKARHEVAHLLQRIRALTHELRELEQHGITGSVVEAKRRLLDQLRSRLATLAPRTVAGGLGAAS